MIRTALQKLGNSSSIPGKINAAKHAAKNFNTSAVDVSNCTGVASRLSHSTLDAVVKCMERHKNWDLKILSSSSNKELSLSELISHDSALATGVNTLAAEIMLDHKLSRQLSDIKASEVKLNNLPQGKFFFSLIPIRDLHLLTFFFLLFSCFLRYQDDVSYETVKKQYTVLCNYFEVLVQKAMKKMTLQIVSLQTELLKFSKVTQENQKNTKHNEESINDLKYYVVRQNENHKKATRQLEQKTRQLEKKTNELDVILQDTQDDLDSTNQDLTSTKKEVALLLNQAKNNNIDTQDDLDATKKEVASQFKETKTNNNLTNQKLAQQGTKINKLEDSVNSALRASNNVDDRCNALETVLTRTIESILDNRDTIEHNKAKNSCAQARKSSEDQKLTRMHLINEEKIWNFEQRLFKQTQEKATIIYEQAFKAYELAMQAADTKRNIAHIRLQSSLHTYEEKTKIFERDQEAALQAIQNFEDHKKRTSDDN